MKNKDIYSSEFLYELANKLDRDVNYDAIIFFLVNIIIHCHPRIFLSKKQKSLIAYELDETIYHSPRMTRRFSIHCKCPNGKSNESSKHFISDKY